MAQKTPILSHLEKAIRDALMAHPEGLDIFQVRALVAAPTDTQQHLDRRLRALDPFYRIKRNRKDGKTVYVFLGERPEGEWGFSQISSKVRAEIYKKAGGRCQMCGMNIAEDCIKLAVDHKIPQAWGGTNDTDNLWAICSVCNEGKKNYFATFDENTMKTVLAPETVHERILALLHLKQNEWVEGDFLEFVANFKDFQEDWQKRLRDLRYLGLHIESSRRRSGRRVIGIYRLTNWIDDLPPDLSAAARDYERRRAERNSATQRRN